jgi:hypothetical protein
LNNFTNTRRNGGRAGKIHLVRESANLGTWAPNFCQISEDSFAQTLPRPRPRIFGEFHDQFIPLFPIRTNTSAMLAIEKKMKWKNYDLIKNHQHFGAESFQLKVPWVLKMPPILVGPVLPFLETVIWPRNSTGKATKSKLENRKIIEIFKERENGKKSTSSQIYAEKFCVKFLEIFKVEFPELEPTDLEALKNRRFSAKRGGFVGI